MRNREEEDEETEKEEEQSWREEEPENEEGETTRGMEGFGSRDEGEDQGRPRGGAVTGAVLPLSVFESARAMSQKSWLVHKDQNG